MLSYWRKPAPTCYHIGMQERLLLWNFGTHRKALSVKRDAYNGRILCFWECFSTRNLIRLSFCARKDSKKRFCCDFKRTWACPLWCPTEYCERRLFSIHQGCVGHVSKPGNKTTATIVPPALYVHTLENLPRLVTLDTCTRFFFCFEHTFLSHNTLVLRWELSWKNQRIYAQPSSCSNRSAQTSRGSYKYRTYWR